MDIYWIPSDTGMHGFFKVRVNVPAPQANAIFGLLQKALRSHLRSEGLRADVEIKGTIGYLDGDQWRSGLFGKLPVHRPAFDVEEFEGKEIVNAERLRILVNYLIKTTPASPEPAELDLAELVEQEMAHGKRKKSGFYDQQPNVTNQKSQPIDPADDPDSLHRQLMGLLPLARKLKRVPQHHEAMEFIKLNKLYSGDWDHNLRKRERRVAWILKYNGRTFDSGKCSKSLVNNDWRKLAKKLLPNPIFRGRGRKRTNLNRHELARFLACVENVQHGPRDDNYEPGKRVAAIWKNSLAQVLIIGSGRWPARSWWPMALSSSLTILTYGDRTVCDGS